MTRGYARVAHAMEGLASHSPAPYQGSALPIGPDRDIHEARLAKDHDGRLHLLLRLPPGRTKFQLPLGDLLPVTWHDDHDQPSIDVCNSDSRLTPTFLSLIVELLDGVDDSGDTCIDVLMRVLASWREALAREMRGLSRANAIGLFGELFVLAKLASIDPGRAGAAWRGKDGYRHDFFLRNALEVKAYLGVESPTVEIHGAHQLDPPEHASLHLLALRLEENDGGKTINDLLDEIDSYGLPRSLLMERSTDEAPVVTESTTRFIVANQRLFHVTERFPGIRFSNLGEDAFKAVSRLRYSLHLDSCPDSVDPSELEGVLKRL